MPSSLVKQYYLKVIYSPAHFLRLIKSKDASLAGEGDGPTFAC